MTRALLLSLSAIALATASAHPAVASGRAACVASRVLTREAGRPPGAPLKVPFVKVSPDLYAFLFYYRPGLVRIHPRAVIYTNRTAPGNGTTKILWWVIRGHAGFELTVDARSRTNGHTHAQFPVAGTVFFPSLVNVTSPGCWTITARTGSAKGTVTMLALRA